MADEVVEMLAATLGTLPWDDGLRLLQGSRDLLLAAAYSAHQAQAHYPR